MIITVSVQNNELLSYKEDIDERINELEVKYGGNWRLSSDYYYFIGELNLKEFLASNGLTLVI
jgi:hypothetical protein